MILLAFILVVNLTGVKAIKKVQVSHRHRRRRDGGALVHHGPVFQRP